MLGVPASETQRLAGFRFPNARSRMTPAQE
jgi:hypothetical protein